MAIIIVYAPGVEETFLQQATVELLKELYQKALKPEIVQPYLDALDRADLRMASSSEEVLPLFQQGRREERGNYLKTRLRPLVLDLQSQTGKKMLNLDYGSCIIHFP